MRRVFENDSGSKNGNRVPANCFLRITRSLRYCRRSVCARFAARYHGRDPPRPVARPSVHSKITTTTTIAAETFCSVRVIIFLLSILLSVSLNNEYGTTALSCNGMRFRSNRYTCRARETKIL